MSNIRELSQLASVINVNDETKNVGIGTTNPESKLSVGGDLTASGNITAVNFYGDGSQLTGISASSASSSSQWVTTSSGIHTLSNVGIGTTNPTAKLQVIGDVLISGVITAVTGNFSGIITSSGAIISGVSTVNGKITAGNQLNNINLSNTLNYNSSSGITAFRPISLVDSAAGIKISRNAGQSSGAAIELQTWDVGIVTNYSYWDVNAENGYFGIRDRKNAFTRIFIDDSGSILLGANSASFSNNYSQLVGIGTDKLLNVLGNSYISGSVGIGTTNPTSKLNVGGDARITGVITATTFIGALTGNVTGNVTGTATTTTNIPNLTGDVTSVNTTTTLATVNDNVGTYGSSTAIPSITVNAKGLVTGVTTNAITVGDGTLTLNVTGVGLTGSQTFSANQSGAATFTVTSNATSNNTNFAIVARDGSGNFSAGIITASQFVTGASGSAIGINTNTISGPSEITIDPAAVGDNTGAVRIKGNLFVDGTETFINSTTIELADFNVGIATTVGTNLLLDGAGIGIGSTGIRKTITWNNTAQALTSSEDWNLALGKQYEIGGTSVLTSTTLGSNIVNSSLTSVDTLTKLDVGNVNSTGIVTASSFSGALTGNVNSSGVSTFVSLRSTNINVTGIVTATTFVGALTGTATSTTNIPNLTGAITSNNTITSLGSFTSAQLATALTDETGSGSAVFATSPSLVAPSLGAASATNINVSGVTTSTGGFVGALTGNVTGNATGLSGTPNITVGNITSGNVNSTGVVTATTFSGNLTGNVNSTGVSTFTNGPVFIGAATSTGTSSQRLQVTGGAYVSTRLGVGVTNPAANTQVAIAGTLGISEVGGAGTRTLLFSSSSGFTLNHSDNSNIDFRVLNGTKLQYQYNSNFWTIPAGIPFLVGTASSTGTANQLLRVEGGAYVSGNLGVGVTNSAPKLDVYSPTSGSTAIRATSSSSFSSTLYPGVISGLSTNAASSYSSQFAAAGIGVTSGELGVYSFWPTFANFPADRGPRRAVDLVGGFATGTWGTEYFAINVGRNGSANDSGVLTNERLRVDGSGNLGIGTTNPTSKLHVIGDVRITGVITCTNINSTSDISLKTNIKIIEDPLEKVMQINGVSFDWKENQKPSIGVIAQELEKVLPELVTQGDIKSVNYNGLIGVLIEAIKEQQRQIDELKTTL